MRARDTSGHYSESSVLPRRRRPRVRRVLALGLASVVLATTGCEVGSSGEPTPAPTTPSSATPAKPTTISFGVFGPDDEVAAFRTVVTQFNSLATGVEVSLESWPDRAGLMAAVRIGEEVPDVFMASRSDLAWLREQRLLRPVDDLLDARGVDFGDGYSRDALQAFSADNRLQCMPYGISPMVIYYNTDLIDFDRMRERGLNAPEWEVDDEPTWSFDQFAAAASFATRPAKRTRGLYIEPTLRGLAPFVYSGGGALFDNEAEPTSLAFSEEETRSALERSLELLRDPHVNLTERQLAKASPEEWFVRGRVGMIAGFRSMVPRLRRVQGLNWNVMPMPAIDKAATIGDITGLCLAARGDVSMAADFLVQAASARSVAVVTRVGHLAPANLEVALSDEFLQPGRQPANARVFNASMRSMENPPLVLNWGALEEAVAQSLNRLISVPILDLDRLAAQIDRISQRVLQAENDQPAGDASESASTD